MIHVRRAVAQTALLCALLASAGCVKQQSPSTAPAGTLTIALAQEPVSMDPLLLEGPIAYTVSELLYTYLTNYDSSGNVVPDIATEVPTVQNGGVQRGGRRIVFHLRRGVRWQDGTPLTAADVVFTYRAIMNPRNAIPSRYGYDKVTSVSAPDPYTVVVDMKTPFSPIIVMFFGGDTNYPILPQHALAAYPSIDKVAFNETPVASGPYVLAAWRHGDRLEFTANPRYYRGKPAIDRLVMPFVHDPATIVNELHTGEVDAAFSLDASRITSLRSLPAHRIVVTPIPYFYAMGFNLEDPVLRDVNVRRAIALAIDRDTIVRKVSHGVYDARTGLRGLFTWAYDPAADALRYDPRAASQMLERDGWHAGSDSSRTKNGRRLELELSFPAGSQITAQLATAIAAAESSIGVEVSLKRYTREVYLATDGPVMQGRYQLQLYDFHSNYDPDAGWLLACNQRSPGGFNIARYCNPGVDRTLLRGSQSFDRAVRRAAYAEIQRQISTDLPYFFLAQASEIDVVPSDLRNYARPLLSPFNSVAHWVR